jgi:membrane-bound lytic murein transglycosylase MltF
LTANGARPHNPLVAAPHRALFLPRTLLVVILLLGLSIRAGADMLEIRKRGQLRVLVAEGTLPQFFTWKGSARPGLEREVIQGFCRLQRLDLAIVPVSSQSLLVAGLLKRDGDLAAGGLAEGDLSHEDLELSAEVLPSRHVVVTRKPNPTVLTLEELRAQRVGTVRGSALAQAVVAAGVSAAKIDDTHVVADLMSALKGDLGACVVGIEQALPAQREDGALEIGMYLGGRLSRGFALRKGDRELRGALNEYISNLRRSPAFNRLVLSHFGDSAADILKATR